MAEEKAQERRKFERVEGKTYTVKFRRIVVPPPRGTPTYYAGEAVDLSRGGMRFRTTHAVQMGDRIHYELNSPSGKSGRSGMARVIRVRVDKEAVMVAVEFLE